MINNSFLTAIEISWIDKLLACDFDNKEQVITQINNSEVKKEYNKFYISIQFDVNKSVDRILCRQRVPVEMMAFSENKVPILFLLHIIDGYVSELEIFAADSSAISYDLDLDDYSLKYIIEGNIETPNSLR